MSKILKGDLYDFIERKYVAEKVKAQKELDAIVSEFIREPVKAIVCPPYESIKSQIAKLSDDYEGYLDAFNEQRYDYRRKLTELSYMSGHGNNIVSDKVNSIKSFFNGQTVTISNPVLGPVAMEKAEAAYKPVINRLNDLRTLDSELKAIIKASGSGKIAYDTLVSLGIDMKDFVAGTPNLPAVRKLSVDVCVINGGC